MGFFNIFLFTESVTDIIFMSTINFFDFIIYKNVIYDEL